MRCKARRSIILEKVARLEIGLQLGGFSGSRSDVFKSDSTCAILWVVGNMQSLNERLASLAIRREKMREKRLMTGEGLLGNEEIGFLTSSDVTGLKVLKQSCM